MPTEVETFQVPVKGKENGEGRSVLRVYFQLRRGRVEGVRASVEAGGWEIARDITETMGAWRPDREVLWRRVGTKEWLSYRSGLPKPNRAQVGRATIEPHLSLIGKAMQARGLPHPYSARGPRRKLDATEVDRRKASGETDAEIARALGVSDHTVVAKQRHRDKLSRAGRSIRRLRPEER